MMKKILLIFTGILFISLSVFAQAKQNRESLQKEAKKLEESIQKNQKLLDQTQNEKNTALIQMQLLQKQIDSRNKLIKNMSGEVNALENEANECQKKLIILEQNVSKLKAEYANMLIAMQKHRRNKALWLFVLAANDIQQAIQRYRYIKEFSDNLQRQVETINKEQAEIEEVKQNIEKNTADKKIVLAKQESEKTQLDKQQTEKDKLQKSLKAQESKLKKQIKDDQAQSKKLNQKIKDVIAAEIEAERKKAEAKNKSEGKPTPANIPLTPEEQKLNADFASNKGKLPWPCEWGSIISQYGIHPHPDIKGVQTDNSGIDILTNSNTICRAIFGGMVTSVFASPNNAAVKTVIIKHGTYRTVYANLSSVSVTPGQKVSTKQNIGTVFFNKETNQTVINFQVWQDKSTLDPERWILKN
ncbi:peptidase M23 [Bacteroidia bacterium]|nr:peptidase M23 [Bacteroidia bacterium]GHV44747.1 peptidase M23 [Bacteroidia bacterium]